MYHILAAQRQRQYGSSLRENQALRATSLLLRADPPGLVQLAPALRTGIGSVKQQRHLAAARRDLDLLRTEDEVGGLCLKAEPVERRLAQGRLDPRAKIGGHGD